MWKSFRLLWILQGGVTRLHNHGAGEEEPPEDQYSSWSGHTREGWGHPGWLNSGYEQHSGGHWLHLGVCMCLRSFLPCLSAKVSTSHLSSLALLAGRRERTVQTLRCHWHLILGKVKQSLIHTAPKKKVNKKLFLKQNRVFCSNAEERKHS